MGLSDFSVEDGRRELRSLMTPLEDEVASIRNDLRRVTTTVAAQQNFGEIVNVIDDSHPEWSTAAYTGLGVTPASAGDTNLEAYGHYHQPQADTALAVSSLHALKAPKTIEPADHTLWAANEAVDLDIPRWDKVNGPIEMGGAINRYDMFLQLPNDIVYPGQSFIFQFEAMMRTATPLPAGLQVYCGFHDNTVGQQKYIEGGNFTITDENGNDPGVTFGIPGATSVNYRILARTDSGEEALSNILNFPNAPAVFDQNNHPRIRFSGVPGFIEFEIYRERAGVFVRQYTVRNTIDAVYYDVGNPPEATVAGWPAVTTTVPRAFAQTSLGPGTLNGTGFLRHVLRIFVPTTYNRGLTGAGMQFFRWGFSGLTTDPRQVLVRRLGLSMGDGAWARSANDMRTGVHSTPSSTATGAPGGDSGPIGPPPPPGGGHCVLSDTPVRLFSSRLTVPLRSLGYMTLTDSGGGVCGAVKRVKLAYSGMIYRIRTANGLEIGCTHEEPFITSWEDYDGTPASVLKARFVRGEQPKTLTSPKDVVELSEIVSITEEYGDFTVGSPVLKGSKIYIGAGFLLHNKAVEELP